METEIKDPSEASCSRQTHRLASNPGKETRKQNSKRKKKRQNTSNTEYIKTQKTLHRKRLEKKRKELEAVTQKLSTTKDPEALIELNDQFTTLERKILFLDRIIKSYNQKQADPDFIPWVVDPFNYKPDYRKKWDLPILSQNQLNFLQRVYAADPPFTESIFDLSSDDFRTLRPIDPNDMKISNYWASDATVFTYIRLCINSLASTRKVFCIDPLISSQIISGSHYSMAQKYSKETLFEYDLILFPIIKNKHWTLIHFDLKLLEIRHWDPMLGSPNPRWISFVKFFLHQRLAQEKPTKCLAGLRTIETPMTQTQQNNCDCGLFVMFIARALIFIEPLVIKGSDSTQFRQLAAYELAAGSIISMNPSS